MDSSPTLQDFVLNLIYDPAARSAFELDPESTLQHAGLGDITAADVRQVIPLVVDSAPVTGLNTPAGADDLATGVANLDVAGAVSHLQAITAQVAYSATSVVGDAGLSLAGAANSVDLGGLSAGNDPGLHLDADGLAGATTPATNTAADVHAVVDHTAPGLDTSLTGGLDSVANLPSMLPLDHAPDLDVAGVGGAVSSIGSVVRPDLGHVLSGDPLNDPHNAVTTVTGGHDVTGDVVHGVTHPAEHDPLHDLLGGLHL